MSSVLVISADGNGGAIASRLAEESDVVRLYFGCNKKVAGSGHGNVTVIHSLSMLEQFDFVLFDGNGFEGTDYRLREKGIKAVGGGSFGRKVANDAVYGRRVAESLLEDVDSSEECPPKGIDLSVTGWFDGESFINCFVFSGRYKRFMDGDKGVETENMGSVVWAVAKPEDSLVKKCLLPLAELLQKVRHVGLMGVNVTVTEDDIYFNRFETWPVYEDILAFTEILKGSLFDFLLKLVLKKHDRVDMFNTYGMAVRLSVPPYPYKIRNYMKCEYDSPVMDKKAKKHVLLNDICNDSSILGYVSARGVTSREAGKRIGRTVTGMNLKPEVQYRTDIGHDIEKKIELLKTWGWLNV
ncbi:MAG: hypothetical protein OCU18_03690 [Candidatus Syntrophoarchaeum sp.]|nr:hypothetical protein [Candidatus Syntrophoarchaeum sp.]